MVTAPYPIAALAGVWMLSISITAVFLITVFPTLDPFQFRDPPVGRGCALLLTIVVGTVGGAFILAFSVGEFLTGTAATKLIDGEAHMTFAGLGYSLVAVLLAGINFGFTHRLYHALH